VPGVIKFTLAALGPNETSAEVDYRFGVENRIARSVTGA
jgi:hypothetical protein